MKKILVLLLVLALLPVLGSCSQEVEVVAEPAPAAQTETPAEAAPAESTAAPVEPAPDAANEPASLHAILDDIAQSVHPGSSGCSLRAARCAAELLDWSAQSTIPGADITDDVAQWAAALDADTLAIFTESLGFVADTCPQLQSDTAQDLLESAGVNDSGYPWSDAAYQTAEYVFAAVNAG